MVFDTKIPFSIHKYFEIEMSRIRGQEASFLVLSFRWTRCRDHAGAELEFEVLGLSLRIVVYDHRHWDYDKKTWQVEK